MRTYILTFFILFSGLTFSQNAGFRKTSISSSFSPVQIEAYQESADKKIEDFYSYLNLLSDKSISEKTKVEIRENIFLLFKDQKTEVIDLVSDEHKKVSLLDFLDKTKNQNIKFRVIQIESTPVVIVDYWISEYSIEITLNGEKSVKKISQKVYFSPVYKQFGSTAKEVWEIKLGEMQ